MSKRQSECSRGQRIRSRGSALGSSGILAMTLMAAGEFKAFGVASAIRLVTWPRAAGSLGDLSTEGLVLFTPGLCCPRSTGRARSKRVPSHAVSGSKRGAGGRQSLWVWHCCELLVNFRLSFWTSRSLLGSYWRVSVRLEKQEQPPLTAAFTPGP